MQMILLLSDSVIIVSQRHPQSRRRAQDGHLVRLRLRASTIQGNQDQVRLHTPALDRHPVATAEDLRGTIPSPRKHRKQGSEGSGDSGGMTRRIFRKASKPLLWHGLKG